ncbi:hypothetical protein [Clostridium sp.]|uniref:hypothetical protein n=1 Tax=Clostridium sp. TaxID=1506 RepID=UPI002A8005EA|nr:hypothetical protein [Clostridium sp.]MCI7083631.1 hypothetical protein [Mycoplasmatota bacterium]MDY4253911.1 hypothetical protein [Clostridium sp.]
MKFVKRFFIIIFSSLLILNTNLIPAYANSNTDPNIELIRNLNDSNWNEFLDNLDLNSNNVSSGEFYMKVYEDSDHPIIDNKVYTFEDYVRANMFRANMPNGSNWIKFFYSAYPHYNNPEKVGIIGGFEWMQTPTYQLRDIFTISSDSNFSIPGATDKVNVSFWPNISAPTIVGSYTTGDSRIEFDTYGISAHLDLSGFEFKNEINQLENWPNYFTMQPNSGELLTNGCPKGIVGFNIGRSRTSVQYGKICLTYNHKQVEIASNSSVSVDSSSNVTLTGIGIAYDTVVSSVSYHWGDYID